jgi:hypothetical protein
LLPTTRLCVGGREEFLAMDARSSWRSLNHAAGASSTAERGLAEGEPRRAWQLQWGPQMLRRSVGEYFQASIHIFNAAFPRSSRRSRRSRSLNPEIYRRCLPTVLFDFIFDLLTFIKRGQSCALDGRDMDEYVLPATLRLNESITLRRIEPFHCAARHSSSLQMTMYNITVVAGLAAKITIELSTPAHTALGWCRTCSLRYAQCSGDRRFGHTADPTLGDLVLVFLFLLLAVSALAPPARNHSAFVSFLFVADLLVLGWLFFFADFFVFIGYLLVRGAIWKAKSSIVIQPPAAGDTPLGRFLARERSNLAAASRAQ